MLFFIRLRAVYLRNKYVIIFFASGWLVVLSIFTLDSIKAIRECSKPVHPPQSTCFQLRHSEAWGYIATAVYDTLMYLAISWKLASFAAVERWQNRLRSFVTGDGLGWLSKVLLQSGQLYYL